jgi:hypothetical protein
VFENFHIFKHFEEEIEEEKEEDFSLAFSQTPYTLNPHHLEIGSVFASAIWAG